jgi:ABC-type Fe3+ transport system permease subunit
VILQTWQQAKNKTTKHKIMISSTTDFISPLIWNFATTTLALGVLTALIMLAVGNLLELAVRSICLFLGIED